MPNRWPLVPLGDVLIPSDEWVDLQPNNDYQEVTVKLWGKGVVLRRQAKGAEVAVKRRLIVHKNQFILSRIDARNGAFGLIPDALDGAIVSNDFPVFNPAPSRILPAFLAWMSKTQRFVEVCKAASEGTTNRVRLKVDRFLETNIPLPPLDEQRRIMTHIETLAAKTEQARGLRKRALEQTQSVSTATAQRILGTVDQPISRLVDWTDPECDAIQTGPFGAQLGSSDFTLSGVPVLTIGNVQFGGLAVTDLKYVMEEKANQLLRYQIRTGDVLFARMGTVGRCCLVPPEADGWLINYHIIRVRLDAERIEPRYVHWSIRASSDIGMHLEETIRGATRQGVNSNIVAQIPLRVPSISEQRRIVVYLDDFQAKVDALKRLQAETAAELDALLPSILDKAFKGEL